MRIAVIIPARYQSTRFEGKPLALINGKPMIQWVYERSQKANKISDVVVATDNQRIYDTVIQFKGKALMTLGNHQSGTDRLAEAAHMLDLSLDDVIVNVQGDQPLIHPECIDQVVSPFYTQSDCQMSTLAFKIIDPQEYTNPKDAKVVFNNQGLALYFSRAPIPHDRDGKTTSYVYKHLGVYAYTRQFLEIFNKLPIGKLESLEKLEQLRALENGYPIHVVITKHDSLEVDLPDDIAKIEKYALSI